VLVHFLTLAFGAAITYSGFLVAASMRHMLSPGMQISMSWVYSAAPVCGVLVVLFELESLVDRDQA
ncbi:TRAP transporter small permease subunit, partial [bacterium]|nr:TRAP transporter small permease subunit [bacterium]